MSYLKMALAALKGATNEGEHQEAQKAGISAHVHDYPIQKAPQTGPPERVLTCADCGFHAYQGPNPREGWGMCTMKDKGV